MHSRGASMSVILLRVNPGSKHQKTRCAFVCLCPACCSTGGDIIFAPPQVSEMAYLKLHSLLQTVLCLSWEEVCFLLGQLGSHLWPGGVMNDTEAEHSDTFPHLVPIVRTLLDQHADPITLHKLLPNLPVTNGSTTFAQDLKAFCHTVEWQGFYHQEVCVWRLKRAFCCL